MKSCFEILPIYSNFAKLVETQFSKCIKNFQSDNALEYTQYAFQALLHSYGTIHHLTCPCTSQQNGRVEWKLRHILDTIRALLLSAKVSAPFWGEDVVHVTSFVELSHFRSSLTTSSILEIFPDKSHIPSTNTLDPPLDFSIQLSDIFYASPK